MFPDPVFNDQSVNTKRTTVPQAREYMTRFVEILRDAPEKGVGSGLRVPDTFHLLEFAPDYNFYTWIDDAAVPREQTSFMLALATMSPFLKEAAAGVLDQALQSEVSVRGKSADCFLACLLLDTLLVSFGIGIWKAANVGAVESRLTDGGGVASRTVTLINLSETAHYAVHQSWIEKRIARSIADMADLWERRGKLFRNLVFCPNVEAQLLSIPKNDPHFISVISALFELQRYFSGWKSGGFNRDAFTKCNPTSKETLNHKAHGPKYLFKTATGQTVACPWHLYVTPGAWRVYFLPDSAQRAGVIGHIGVKLPSVKYPTI